MKSRYYDERRNVSQFAYPANQHKRSSESKKNKKKHIHSSLIDNSRWRRVYLAFVQLFMGEAQASRFNVSLFFIGEP
jgi:hypothetical protein